LGRKVHTDCKRVGKIVIRKDWTSLSPHWEKQSLKYNEGMDVLMTNRGWE